MLTRGVKYIYLPFVTYKGLGGEKSDVPWTVTTAKRKEKFVLVTNCSGIVKVVVFVCNRISVLFK